MKQQQAQSVQVYVRVTVNKQLTYRQTCTITAINRTRPPAQVAL